jgi:ferritin-like metal-binding protein YciE
MAVQDLQDALVEEMRDMLHAEKQITKALKKMARSATHDELREGFEEHLEQTEGQIERLEQAFSSLEVKPRGKQCEGMAGILEEGDKVLEEVEESDTLDAMLIAAAQKVEHYEIASYGTICTWAKMLGFSEVEKLMQQNLDEEKATDAKLTKMAMKINRQAQPA